LAGVFGASLAGCVAVPLSTFAPEQELDYLLRESAIGILLVERRVANKDFAEMLGKLEPAFQSNAADRSGRFPHLRHLALIGDIPAGSRFESWGAFCARADGITPDLAEATAEEVRPSDAGAILFSSGSTATPKGVINSQRGVT